MLTLTHATERDIDLLLVEELRCSSGFRGAFVAVLARLTGRALNHRDGRVSHSRRRLHSRREIDILLEIDGSSERFVVLIENKLDTSEQPQQAESYRTEALALLGDGAIALALTVLVCPEAYAAKGALFAGKFDAVITYECIRSILIEQAELESGELALRLQYRADLLSQAILKSRRGYQAVPLAAVTNFTRKYVALMKDASIPLPPGPSMLKDAPSESKTMIFAPSALPTWEFLPQTRLVHQLREGNANICLYGWGDYFSYLASEIGPSLANTPYRLVPTINKRANGKAGLMIVADTPVVDNTAPFEEQRERIEVGLRVTVELARWFALQNDPAARWAQRVVSIRSTGDENV